MKVHPVRAYIGLGANLGDAGAALAGAVRSLGGLAGTRLRGVSRLYATEPVGPEDQPEFRNAVAALDVSVAGDPASRALELLTALKTLEREAGRRPRERWGPRELDLDLLIFGRARIAIERPPMARSVDAEVDPARAARTLTVPHPLADQRLFVLAPLSDLAPDLVPPGWGRSVVTARRQRVAIEGSDAVRPIAEWDAPAQTWAPLQPR